ncbi:MAG: DNA replication/repair protein RecF, partial [Solimonas sp.]
PAAQVQPWSVELAAAGEEIQAYRAEHLAAIRRRFGQLVERLLGISDWAIVLRSGWPEGQSLLAALDAHLARDRQLGQTQDGPQRAELRLRLQERQTKTLISRGQQKQLIAALLVSQCELIREATGVAPILLVDDFTAELGEDYQRRLLSVLQDYPGQLFITSFERSGLLAKADAGALFHVEQGRVKTLSG